jgi:hypothetical protein
LPRGVKFIENKWWLLGAEGRKGNRELAFLMGTNLPFRMVKVLELDGSDGCMTI